ncbi:hypothetical protein MBLNU457_7837t1 [Dothideomycetes sp. NU457]
MPRGRGNNNVPDDKATATRTGRKKPVTKASLDEELRQRRSSVRGSVTGAAKRTADDAGLDEEDDTDKPEPDLGEFKTDLIRTANNASTIGNAYVEMHQFLKSIVNKVEQHQIGDFANALLGYDLVFTDTAVSTALRFKDLMRVWANGLPQITPAANPVTPPTTVKQSGGIFNQGKPATDGINVVSCSSKAGDTGTSPTNASTVQSVKTPPTSRAPFEVDDSDSSYKDESEDGKGDSDQDAIMDDSQEL